MNARRLWIPGQIDLAQSHQSGQLCGLADADWMQRPEVLPRDHWNRKGASEPNKKKCMVHQSKGKGGAIWNMQHLPPPRQESAQLIHPTYMVRKTMSANQTSQLPTQSLHGNKYIMVMDKIDSNTILVEPMTNCKNAKMIRANNPVLLWLKWAGIVPKKHVFNNEVSDNIKNHTHDTCKLDIELVPPGCHRRNAAKVAIHNFKPHFLSVLAGVADNFPPNLWDWVLPQTKIAIDLIWQSNATPNDLAYTYFSSPFDYNKMLLVPMGCEAQVHEKTDKRRTGAYHSVNE